MRLSAPDVYELSRPRYLARPTELLPHQKTGEPSSSQVRNTMRERTRAGKLSTSVQSLTSGLWLDRGCRRRDLPLQLLGWFTSIALISSSILTSSPTNFISGLIRVLTHSIQHPIMTPVCVLVNDPTTFKMMAACSSQPKISLKHRDSSFSISAS
ncbi:uncharacterized protein CLUP02_14117 [Colletotrichum lupini]|uniref:Uncharacterized protein n=1 Tax=Colletotrichum lupini TaxID=145971 RepID=A0A9Q8T5I9_9PEZI|nr:uncharacterized protein CLUP02_14117 [Colletotrichum lupini]UQC88592.1 hypothetical protein CLUP02_14117 [Colletotrichum lupini]